MKLKARGLHLGQNEPTHTDSSPAKKARMALFGVSESQIRSLFPITPHYSTTFNPCAKRDPQLSASFLVFNFILGKK